MENKKLKWIITACVIILIAILAVLGYIYKDKLTGLFSGASNPTLDWGGAREELNQELPCLAPVQTQPGSSFTFDTEQRFKLYNHTNDRATNVKVNVSSDNASLIASSAVSVSSGSYSNGVWTIPTIEPGAWQYIRFQKSGVGTQPFNLVVSGGEGSLSTSCRDQDFIRFVDPTTTPPTPNPNPGPGPIDTGLPDVQPTDNAIPAPIKTDLGGTGDVKGVTTLAQNTDSLRKNSSGNLVTPVNLPAPNPTCATTEAGLRTLAVTYRVLKNEAVVSILGEGCAIFDFTIWTLGQNQEVLPKPDQDIAEIKTVTLSTGTHYIKLNTLPCSFQSDLYLHGSLKPLAYDWYEHGCGTTPPPPTLTCAPANQTIKAGESATFTATGGNGTYTWSTTGDNPTKPPTGSSATFTYGLAGNYIVTVSSKDALQVEKTATCNVAVTALPTGQTLTCAPASQNAQTGRSVSFTSTYSGQGLSYIWSAPEGTPTNGPGNNFQTTFSTVGTKTVTVTVGGETAFCTVIITASPVALTCSPSTQSIEINKEVTITASGGSGTYAWTALQGNPPSGTGASFKTTFSAPTAQGSPREVKVTSGTEQKICTVTVNNVTTTQQQADLKVIKMVSNPTPLLNGPSFTYTVTLSNLGPNNANGISLRDVLPTAVTYISSTSSQGTYNPTDGVWTVGALNVNAEATLQITGRANAVGTHPNTATITGSSLPDPNPNNNESTATIVVGTGGCTSNCGGSTGLDIGVTKSVSNSSPTLNSTIQFTVTATNNGPNAATGVTLRDLLPSQVTYVSNTPSVGTYNSTTGIWTIGSMSVGAQASLQLNVTVNATGSSTNIVTLNTVDQTDSNSANNQAQASITVSAGCTVNCGGGGGGGSVGADIAVTKTVSNTMPSVGQNIVYTIGVYNNGGQNATNVVLRDILPSGIQYVSSSTNQGSYSQATGLWTVGSLNVGASAQLQITGTVTITGTIINTAQVSSLDQTDSNSTNNQASATIVVSSSGGSGADIAVNKTASNDTPAVGGQVTFTINVVNRGPNDAGNVTISDVLPSQVKFLKVQASQGSYDKNTGIWTIGSLANGASAVLQITVTVLKVDNITNLARVNTSDQPDPDTTNNQSQVTITSHAAPGLPAAGINTAASITIGFLFILLAIVIRFLGSTKQQLILADDSRKIVTKTRFD